MNIPLSITAAAAAAPASGYSQGWRQDRLTPRGALELPEILTHGFLLLRWQDLAGERVKVDKAAPGFGAVWGKVLWAGEMEMGTAGSWSAAGNPG